MATGHYFDSNRTIKVIISNRREGPCGSMS